MGSHSDGTVTNVPATDLEIVGFNGAPRVECGRDVPIVRQRSTDTYSRLGGTPSPARYSAAEIEAFRAQGRLTLLPQPTPVPTTAIEGERLAQPVAVLWVRESFLQEVGRLRPSTYNREPLQWQEVPDAERWASCACASTIEQLLNLWGRDFLQQANPLLSSAEGGWGQVKRLADLGLCAAIDRRLRFELYLRYTAAQYRLAGAAHVRRTFDCLFHHEFPDVPWEHFEHHVTALSRGPSPRDPSRNLFQNVAADRGRPRWVA